MRNTIQELDSVTVRFCGDSGDGMQLAGNQLALASAALGNDVHTLPDLPAEIRAPAGSLAGVSGFQVQFGGTAVHTSGDRVQTLVAMNPAALRANLHDVEIGGIIIVNTDSFIPAEWQKAGYAQDPLTDGTLDAYRVIRLPIHTSNREAVSQVKLTPREIDRCKNFFALGLVYWLYERPLEPTLAWLKNRFAGKPDVLQANRKTLKAGYRCGETLKMSFGHFRVGKSALSPGKYRRVSGTDAVALGLAAAAQRAGRELVFAGYPAVTPASDLLQQLIEFQRFGVRAVQAEDEIAAAGMALGASFGGSIGVTATTGPGICLKSELVNLAVMAELPLVVIDVQRAGPSNGMPSKTEQADLLQVLFGRNGESPVVVLAPRTPADCFTMTLEAVRIATRYMTPVFLLSDFYLALAAEPWRIPPVDELPDLRVASPTRNGQSFKPYQRDVKLARPWAIPGTPGLEHRIGGLEKEDGSGGVSYEPTDHEHMVHVRAQKVGQIAGDIPMLEVEGPSEGDLLVVGWGSTYGAIRTAVERAQARGRSVAHAHPRYLNPLPYNTEEVLRRYDNVLVAELNSGQLRRLLRAEYLIDAKGLNKVQGRPFLVAEIEAAIEAHHQSKR